MAPPLALALALALSLQVTTPPAHLVCARIALCPRLLRLKRHVEHAQHERRRQLARRVGDARASAKAEAVGTEAEPDRADAGLRAERQGQGQTATNTYGAIYSVEG